MFRMFQRGDSKGTAFGIMFIINIALWGIAGFGCWVVIGLAVAAYRWAGPNPRVQTRWGWAREGWQHILVGEACRAAHLQPTHVGHCAILPAAVQSAAAREPCRAPCQNLHRVNRDG